MKDDLVTPERMLLRCWWCFWGCRGGCLSHCITAYRIAQQPHNKQNCCCEEKKNKTGIKWGKKGRAEMKKSRTADKIHSIHRQPYCTPTDLAVSHRNPQSPRHEIFFLLYESKGSLVENERLHKPEPKTSASERSKALLPFKAPAIVWASIQAYCCAEISRAPFRSRGMRRTPLLFGVHICGYIDAWPRLPSPLAVALCPFPKAQYEFFSLTHSVLFIF